MRELSALSRSARLYLWVVIATGSGVTLLSAAQLYMNPVPRGWVMLATLTALTGSFTIRVPAVAARISVSDAFVFASVLLFGPSAATVIVALDCLVMAVWGQRNLVKSLFNLSGTSVAIWLASKAFYSLAQVSPGSQDLEITSLIGPLFVLATLYFLINTALVAIALGFERQTSPWFVWREHFSWLSLNYFAGVSVAALLVSYTRSVDFAAISIIVPLLVIAYLTHQSWLGRIQDAQLHVEQVNELYMSTIEALAMAVDAKDQITHGHIRRVQTYAVELAKRLGVSQDRQLKAIATAALLHDMGKLAIPEHILNKPGKLSPAEFDKIKRHADIGADLLSSVKFPYPVVPIVRHHHENWDGTGYPAGISGADIPLGARILSVVDCFDALTSDRPYRPRLSTSEAFAIINQRRAQMYDPLVVDTFVRAYAEMAPAAIKAGQEARSISVIDTHDLAAGVESSAPLTQIRANSTETTLLARCEKDIGRATSASVALQLAAQCLRQVTPATVYALFEYEQKVDELTCRSSVGDELRLLEGLTIRLGERVTGWSAANRRASLNSDASLDLAQISNRFVPALRSTIAMPLTQGEDLLGVLTAYSHREEAFNQNHRYAFERVSIALLDRITSLQSQTPLNLVSFRTQKSRV